MVENHKNMKQMESDRKGVVWIDLDDTLWDFKANSRVALAGMYADHDLSRWFESVHAWIECYERHNHALWNQYNKALITKDYLMSERFLRPLLEAQCLTAHEFAQKFDHEYLDRLAECTQLVDGAIHLLCELKSRGWETGILSNGFTEVQHRKIRNSGLSPYVDHIVLSDDIGVNKPDVRLYRHAQEIASVSPTRCVMIGDNLDTDIAGAVAARWHAIHFSRNCGDSSIEETVPTIKSLDDALLQPVFSTGDQ